MNEIEKMEHECAIKNILEYINSKTNDYILKGGTALKMCYGLDRFSEDIDFDSTNKEEILKLIPEACKKFGYSYNLKKNTDTVKRFMINYGNEQKPLKVKTSFKNNYIDLSLIVKENGIQTYEFNYLAQLKLNAYLQRDKVRDLYDISFIGSEKIDKLSPTAKAIFASGLSYKGLEQFDYVSNQEDSLVDKEKMLDRLLRTYENLHIDTTIEEKEIIKANKNNKTYDDR